MQESSLRRRLPAPGGRRVRKFKPPHASSSAGRRSKVKARLSRVGTLKRSSSEQSLCGGGDAGEGGQKGKFHMPSEAGHLLCLPPIGSTVFASSPSLLGGSPLSTSPLSHESYNKDAKVVINVSVEGSPGPIRTMVKLSCNVEETIRTVIDKYSEERRTPKLDKESAFELHHSPFSLQNLDKSEVIGDIGSRSFYLRKSVSSCSNSSGGSSHASLLFYTPELVPARGSVTQFSRLLGLITQKISNMMTKAAKILKLLVCIP